VGTCERSNMAEPRRRSNFVRPCCGEQRRCLCHGHAHRSPLTAGCPPAPDPLPFSDCWTDPSGLTSPPSLPFSSFLPFSLYLSETSSRQSLKYH